ncbi:hypothetical protein ACVIHC_000030 [Bradyrhizobium diazoefficiens]
MNNDPEAKPLWRRVRQTAGRNVQASEAVLQFRNAVQLEKEASLIGDNL